MLFGYPKNPLSVLVLPEVMPALGILKVVAGTLVLSEVEESLEVVVLSEGVTDSLFVFVLPELLPKSLGIFTVS